MDETTKRGCISIAVGEERTAAARVIGRRLTSTENLHHTTTSRQDHFSFLLSTNGATRSGRLSEHDQFPELYDVRSAPLVARKSGVQGTRDRLSFFHVHRAGEHGEHWRDCNFGRQAGGWGIHKRVSYFIVAGCPLHESSAHAQVWKLDCWTATSPGGKGLPYLSLSLAAYCFHASMLIILM